jgi:hypothetical protein
MRTSTRRTTLLGTAAGLTLVLASPFAASADATGHHGGSSPGHRGGHETGRHGWHSPTNPAEHTAQKALRAAIRAATGTYRTTVHTARATFRNDPVVQAAAATRAAVLRTATDPQLILDADAAYLLATSAQQATLDAAVQGATTAWITSVDTAYTAYDNATTSPDEAEARAAFRTAVRTATVELRASTKQACADFRKATAPARATLRAAVNKAEAAYLAGPQGDADRATLHDAIEAARTAFTTDAAVNAAKDARRTAVTAARTTYKAEIKAARDAFFAATGHNPYRWKPVLPRV